MGARLMESQPEVPSVRQLPRGGMSVSPELSAPACCFRPELLLEVWFLDHYCYVPVHLLSPSASQAKGNITIQSHECESMGPVTPNLLCSLPFFFFLIVVQGFFVWGAQGMQEPFLSPPCPRLLCREASPQLPLASSTARLETREDRAQLCKNI